MSLDEKHLAVKIVAETGSQCSATTEVSHGSWYHIDSFRHSMAFFGFALFVLFTDLEGPNTQCVASNSNMLAMVFLYLMDTSPVLGYYAFCAGFNSFVVGFIGIISNALDIKAIMQQFDEGHPPENIFDCLTEHKWLLWWHIGIVANTIVLSLVYALDVRQAKRQSKCQTKVLNNDVTTFIEA